MVVMYEIQIGPLVFWMFNSCRLVISVWKGKTQSHVKIFLPVTVFPSLSSFFTPYLLNLHLQLFSTLSHRRISRVSGVFPSLGRYRHDKGLFKTKIYRTILLI